MIQTQCENVRLNVRGGLPAIRAGPDPPLPRRRHG